MRLSPVRDSGASFRVLDILCGTLSSAPARLAHSLTGGAANHNAGAASRSAGGSRRTATCNGRGVLYG